MTSLSFAGEFEHRLDDRGRLAVPAAFRGAFEHGGYLLPGPDGQLELHTLAGYQDVARQRASSPEQSREARRRARILFGRAFPVQLDRQGRILIPPKLRELRQLDGAAVVVGMGGYLEIWNEAAWRTESDALDAEYAELLQMLSDVVQHADAAIGDPVTAADTRATTP